MGPNKWSLRLAIAKKKKKKRLETITLAQWSFANLAIPYRLVEELRLHTGNILDYLSYTTKICQLLQRYTLASDLLYDRKYRQLKSRHGFRCGTDVLHIHTIHLQSRVVRQTHPAPVRTNIMGTKEIPHQFLP